jgi:hypothetical protein
VRRRSVAGSLPRRGVGCRVPLLTHLRSQDIHRRQPLGQSGYLAPAPPSWPGLFFWWRRSCCGERWPSVPLTQNQSDPCAIAHDQSQLWRGQTPGPGAAVIDFSSLNEGHGRRHIAFARHLLAFCIAFRCVEGQCLQSLNRPRRDERGGRATVRSADCHRGADAAARGAMGTIESRIPVAYQTEFNPHTRPRSIRARPSGRATSRPPSRLSITRAVSSPSPI